MDLAVLYLLLVGAVIPCFAFLVQPQLYPNASLIQPGILSDHALSQGIFGRATDGSYCQQGYFACRDDTTKCCPVGSSCCLSNQYCVYAPSSCCGLGSCPGGTKCCGDAGCISLDSDCCDNGRHCSPGTYCRVWQGRDVCCPASGCRPVTTTRALSTSEYSPPTSSPTSQSDPVTSRNAPFAIAGVAIGMAGAAIVICALLFSTLIRALVRRRKELHLTYATSPSSPASRDQATSHDNRGCGWKVTLYLGSTASLVVLLFNTGFAAWALRQNTEPDGTGVLFEGQCQRARSINTGFHLVINILATLVLGASSFGMQCLSAPTRENLDHAHRRGDWLDIGILSMRNLSSLPRKRLVLWISLALSTLPLHLLYNSTVFLTTGAYETVVLIGNSTFTELSTTTLKETDETLTAGSIPSLVTLRDQEANGGFHRMDNQECVNTFSVNLQSAYGALLLVSHKAHPEDRSFDYVDSSPVTLTHQDSWYWMCEASNITYSCAVNEVRAHADTLTITIDRFLEDINYRVDYCLAQKVPERCKVKYSLPLLFVVIIFNIVKAAILWGITMTSSHLPLLTAGDAMAEFLEKPDPFSLPRTPWKYDKKRQRWYKVVSRARWVTCFLLLAGSIATIIGLMIYASISDGHGTFSDAWTLGLGAANIRYLIQESPYRETLPANTMTANIPQVIFSFIYFSINGALTAMVQANEWSQYARTRKGLRVSTSAEGEQRSAYFLSLPYRYSVPQLLFSMVLHWLISQSLFLVYVESYSPTLARSEYGGFITCGYSPLAILCTLAVGSLMGVALVVLACGFRFESGMPIAGSSSLAIAAACHPYPALEESGEMYERSGTERKALQWGVVLASYKGEAHCSFSDEDVNVPVDQSIYL